MTAAVWVPSLRQVARVVNRLARAMHAPSSALGAGTLCRPDLSRLNRWWTRGPALFDELALTDAERARLQQVLTQLGGVWEDIRARLATDKPAEAC